MNLNFNQAQQKNQNPEVEMTCGLEEMSDEELLPINGGVTVQLEFESEELNSVEAGVSARFERLGLGL
ncbi:hypothetical protein [Microcoleus sp. BROC3]|uniref:hypothetical protein n=1 Tax=Microcoleus sp. BROC3 TaxID=3055323 RepID=UPI002FD1D9FD